MARAATAFNAGAVDQPTANGAVAHVRFNGRSFDVPLAALNLEAGSGDAMIKRALAGYLEVTPTRLDDYAVDRHPNGNLTVRPEAVFG